MISRSKLLGCLAALPLLFALSCPGYARTEPIISHIRFLQKAHGITAKIFGANFGNAPVHLPCFHCTITELQLIYFIGDNEPFVPVTIKKWTDSFIEVSGLAATPGTTAIFSVKNDALGTTAARTANFPGGPTAPNIRRLVFLRDHKHLKVIVEGSGFGSAPAGIPGNTDSEFFQLWIWVTGGDVHNYPWAAGHGGCSVTLKYTSWTDTRIVIAGFGNAYHDEDWYARKGDAIAVTLANNPGGGGLGPTTGKASRIPTP